MPPPFARALGFERFGPGVLRRMTGPTLELFTHGLHTDDTPLRTAQAAWEAVGEPQAKPQLKKDEPLKRITLPALTPAQHSLFLTLGNRALDSRLSRPFLGDTMAMEVIEKTGYDLDQLLAEQGVVGKLFSIRTLIFEVVTRAWPSRSMSRALRR